MVKPGGTGIPTRLISARPAPLPPRRFFISPLPSACPSPKRYTRRSLPSRTSGSWGRVAVIENLSQVAGNVAPKRGRAWRPAGAALEGVHATAGEAVVPRTAIISGGVTGATGLVREDEWIVLRYAVAHGARVS